MSGFDDFMEKSDAMIKAMRDVNEKYDSRVSENKRCQSFTKSGKQCKNNAVYGSRCYVHSSNKRSKKKSKRTNQKINIFF